MAHNGNEQYPAIEILNGLNYEDWKFQVTAVLRFKAVYEYVTGEDLVTQYTQPKDIKEWRKQDGKAMSILALNIEKKLQHAIQSCSTSKEMWDKLREMHEPKTRDRLIRTVSKFFDLRYTPGTPMASWVAQVFESVKEVKEAGIDVSGKFQCIQIVRSLPPEFEMVAVAINALPDDDFTAAEIEKRLIAEESRLQGKALENGVHWSQAGNQNSSTGRGRRNNNRGGRKTRGRGRGANSAATHNTMAQASYQDDDAEQELDDDEAHWSKPQGGAQNFKCKRCGGQGHSSIRCTSTTVLSDQRRDQLFGKARTMGKPQRAHATIDDGTIHHDGDDEYNMFAEHPLNLFSPIAEAIALDEPQLELSERLERIVIGTEGPIERVEHATLLSIESEAAFSTDTGNLWLMDSGASSHFCNNRDMFKVFREAKSQAKTTGKGGALAIRGYGTIDLKIGGKIIDFANVCYAPDARINLISESRIDRAGYNQSKIDGIHRVVSKQNKPIFQARLNNHFYFVDVQNIASMDNFNKLIPIGPMCTAEEAVNAAIEPGEENTQEPERPAPTSTPAPGKNQGTTGIYELWHKRLGHANEAIIRQLARDNIVKGMPDKLVTRDQGPCNGCSLGKATKASFTPIQKIQSQRTNELLHIDVWGPIAHPTPDGMRYFLSIIDDFSRRVHIYLMQRKGDVFGYFKQHLVKVEREQDSKVVFIRTDNGMEFCHKQFSDYCLELGLQHQRTNIYTPQQNGVAERYNRTMMNHVKTINNTAGLPYSFWGEALMAATYIKNRLPTRYNKETTPIELWTGIKPSVAHCKIYGCLAYAYMPDVKRSKLDNSASEAIMLGYATGTKGYRLLIIDTMKIIETRSAKFDETKYPARKLSNLRIKAAPKPRPRNLRYTFNSSSDSDGRPDSDDDQSKPSPTSSVSEPSEATTPIDSGDELTTSTPMAQKEGHRKCDKEHMHHVNGNGDATLILHGSQSGEDNDNGEEVNLRVDTQDQSTPSMPSRKNQVIEDQSSMVPDETEAERIANIADTELNLLEREIQRDPMESPKAKRDKERPVPTKRSHQVTVTVQTADGPRQLTYDRDDESSQGSSGDSKSSHGSLHFLRKTRIVREPNKAPYNTIYYSIKDTDHEFESYRDIVNYCTINDFEVPDEADFCFNVGVATRNTTKAQH